MIASITPGASRPAYCGPCEPSPVDRSTHTSVPALTMISVTSVSAIHRSSGPRP
jgi:hypothetical protein